MLMLLEESLPGNPIATSFPGGFPPMWPVFKQLFTGDVTCLGDTAFSERTKALQPRTHTADKVVPSVCPYCAVGCGQRVYVKNKRIIDIEGDPDSPISRG